jgi:hypothetical protein
LTAQADLPYLYYLVGTSTIAPGLPPSTLQQWDSITNPFLTQQVQAFYNVVTVPYPASLLDAGDSYYTGIDMTCRQINSHSGPFVLGGASQGAAVISQVLKMLQSGDDRIDGDRLGDLAFGVTFGNPCRQAGKIAPGLTDPGGHGVRMAQFRLTDTPSLWWDFAAPGDLVSVCGDDPISELATAVFEYVWFDANLDISTATQQQIYTLVNQALKTLGQTHSPAQVQQVWNSLWEAATWTIPHDNYTRWMPISGNSSTCVDLANAQLATVATQLGITSDVDNVNPVTNIIPPQGVLAQVAGMLAKLSLRFIADYRFSKAQDQLAVVMSEWRSNPTKAAGDLLTLQVQVNALHASYPADHDMAQAVEYIASLI